MGSVFSPYYAWAGRRNPLDHCAVNVALYGPRGAVWAMTERKHSAVSLSRDAFQIGRSRAVWRDGALSLEIDERTAPIPRRVRGRIEVRAESLNPRAFRLDEAGGHWWRPLMPPRACRGRHGRALASLERGRLFRPERRRRAARTRLLRWTWSRAATKRGAAILYDAQPRRGEPLSLALKFDDRGGFETCAPPPAAALPRTGWGLTRATRADDGRATLLRSFENTPFYARGLVGHRLFGEPLESVHESLSLDRFAHPVVRLMLPFRMPRR